jgi:predicted MFS family arabinose efflux permease
MAAHNSAGLVVLMAFYGFFSGSFVSLPPTIVVSLSMNARDKIGTRLGQSFFVVAFGLLIGTPIGGVVLARGGFVGLWTFGGVMLFASVSLLVAARVSWKGWGYFIKA